MKTLEKVSDFVGKYMAAIVIVVAALALLFPGTFSVVKTAWVNTLLGAKFRKRMWTPGWTSCWSWC